MQFTPEYCNGDVVDGALNKENKDFTWHRSPNVFQRFVCLLYILQVKKLICTIYRYIIK